MSLIRPGQRVATFALPIPLTNVDLIGQAIEAIYGTGEVMLRPAGTAIELYAPADGFGPSVGRVEKLALPPVDEDGDELTLDAWAYNDDHAQLVLSDGQNVLATICETLRAYFDLSEGVNYVSARLVDGSGRTDGWIVTLQRPAGKSPADLRAEAEDRAVLAERRVAELEAQLAALRPDSEPAVGE